MSDTTTLEFDVNTLTVGELEALEVECGIQLLDVIAFIESGGAGSATVMVGLMWVAGRRIDPAYTLDDARAARVIDLEFVGSDGSQS